MRPPGGRTDSKCRPSSMPSPYTSQPRSVELAASTRPSPGSQRTPHGALFSSSSMLTVSGAVSGVIAEVFPDDADRLLGVAHVRAVARGLHEAQRAVRQVAREGPIGRASWR